MPPPAPSTVVLGKGLRHCGRARRTEKAALFVVCLAEGPQAVGQGYWSKRWGSGRMGFVRLQIQISRWLHFATVPVSSSAGQVGKVYGGGI